MIKIALVSSLGASEWISCQSISNNLVKSYEAISEHRFSRIFVSDSMSRVDYWNAAKQICDGKFDKIFFIEHSPHPQLILKKIVEMAPSYKPELIIHVYGDFILHCEKWMEISQLLATFKIQFVVASEKQRKILTKMFCEGKGQVSVVPFPIDASQFYFDPALRFKTRSKMQIKDHEKIILYTGRLSSQKNIIDLLKVYKAVQKNFVPEAKLYLAGPVDDIGYPYFGKISDFGHYNYYLQHYIKSLFPDGASDKVFYLGNLNSAELLPIYNMADLYLSLSTHHDEDYGMAPAEALMTGLPLMLSDWGGYTDFLNYFKSETYSLKTNAYDSKVGVDLNVATKALVFALENRQNNRSELANKAKARLSIESVRKKLAKNVENSESADFLGFNELFSRVVQTFKIDPLAPFGEGPNSSPIYLEVYNDYGS